MKNLKNIFFPIIDKAVGPGKNSQLINVEPTFIPESRVTVDLKMLFQWGKSIKIP